MPAVALSGEFNFQQFTDAGDPLASGRVYTYTAGTTTHKNAYTDSAGAVPHTYISDGSGGQYIGLDSRGELPAPLFLATGAYDIALKRSNATSVWTRRAVGESDGLRIDLASTSDAAKGDALLGAKRTATGAVATTLHAIYERAYLDPARDFGAAFDGSANDTAAIQSCITAAAAASLPVFMPGGTATVTQISIPSNIAIYGAGMGVTIIKVRNATNLSGLVNSDPSGGNSNISISDLTVDGNYSNQSSTVHGVEFTKVTKGTFARIECKDARGTGFVDSTGQFNKWQDCRMSGNGKAAAGYGLYVFNSPDAQVSGGVYDDNCIGIAIEASGASASAERAIVRGVRCRSNRADFSQSGAGVHFEQSSGGTCAGGLIANVLCNDSTGVGINNTACSIIIDGATISGNTKSGVVSSNAVGFNYSGIYLSSNGAGDSVGYRTAMRFDDTALSPASSGTVIGCYARGATTDGLKTLSANSAVRFIENDVSGFTSNYTFASTADILCRSERGSFTGTLTGCTTSPTGTVKYSINGDSVTLDVPTINATSNTTSATVTGMPSSIFPLTAQSVVAVATDNGSNVISWLDIATSGTITLRNGVSSTFTNSGTKGIQKCSITYRLTV